MIKKEIVLNEKRNVSLTGYILDTSGEFTYVPRRPAILVLPGGGYQFCSEREADPVALAYLQEGYHAFVLHYSVRENAVWPNPLEDYEQAIALIREKADEWNIYVDKIAVIGFSAGGHLASCAATMSRNRPNAAILGYAVTENEAGGCNTTAPDAVAAVDSDTCPCFVFASRNDRVVTVDNSIRFIYALAQNNVSFESHIYAYAPHGFSVCKSDVQNPTSDVCSRVPNWVRDSVAWLKDMFGDFCLNGLSEPKCKAHDNGDNELFLSVDCSVGHLLEHPQAAQIVKEFIGQVKTDFDPSSDSVDTVISPMVRKWMLRDLITFSKAGDETIDRLEQQLSKIPNFSAAV